jgi:hypothetical protein
MVTWVRDQIESVFRSDDILGIEAQYLSTLIITLRLDIEYEWHDTIIV